MESREICNGVSSPQVSGRHPTCHFLFEVQLAEKECQAKLEEELVLDSRGCQGTWDNISCWHHAEVGDVVVNACPGALKNLFGRDVACGHLMFYTVVKTLYTLGHSLSLIALITGSAILCLFRKLHCTRNYIHLNLFFSFILRAIAVLVKDAILFSHNENMECHKLPSLINFILFISIIRILVQKLRCPDVGGNDQSQYRRLAKSTLLLIPLFGINYVVFVYMKEETENDTFEAKYKIFFDLGFGSFQGLVVAILYCFLNSEVQTELKRKWLSVCLKRYISRDYRLHSSSMSRSGMDHTAPFHRNSRAQSFLQTETTVVSETRVVEFYIVE
ncbi:hypothetical protein P4O66_000070 [Electrophorus voltai]|uniref:Vasoactive intestinal peptide receptor 2 n=1 Tax=Electrophorus voltai TaxID=2609070 RepID=A0AAD9E6H1_9TELE|nr:hypothetical protein P4O66_000070 [Electrophorus voltai]